MRLLIASAIRNSAYQSSPEEVKEAMSAWSDIRNKWASLGKVICTFYSPGNGLPAPQDGSWGTFKIYEVPDMDTVAQMHTAYLTSEIKATVDCRFVVGKPDNLEKEWLEKQIT
jgi:hypothetical protein